MRKVDAETPADCSAEYGLEMLRGMIKRQHVLCQSDNAPTSSSVVCYERVPFDIRRYMCELTNVMITADAISLHGCQKTPALQEIIATSGVTEACFVKGGNNCVTRSPNYGGWVMEEAPLVCSEHTPHKVLYQMPWDFNNFYEWFGDWVTIWETMVALGWKPSETEVFILGNPAGEGRRYPKPFDEAWELAFREKGVRMGSWPELFATRRCFSHIADVPHGGLSTTTANGGRGGGGKSSRCPSPTLMGAALFLQGIFLRSGTANGDGRAGQSLVASASPHVTLILRRGGRAFDNEAVTEATVRSVLPPGWTFATARLEEMTLPEQLSLIGRTSVLIGVHGAGLTHTMFLPPGARLLEVYCSDRSSANGHYRAIEAMAEIGVVKAGTGVEGTYHFSAEGPCDVPVAVLKRAIHAYEQWAPTRPPPPQPKPVSTGPCALTVFSGVAFQGSSATFAEGVYNSAAYVAGGAVDDQASSLRVAGPCTAVLYQNGDFSGWSASFTAGSYDVGELLARGARNDETSAVMLVRLGKVGQCATNGSRVDATDLAATSRPSVAASTVPPTTSRTATPTSTGTSTRTTVANMSAILLRGTPPEVAVAFAGHAGAEPRAAGVAAQWPMPSAQFVECSSDYQVLPAVSIVAAAVTFAASICVVRSRLPDAQAEGGEKTGPSTIGLPAGP